MAEIQTGPPPSLTAQTVTWDPGPAESGLHFRKLLGDPAHAELGCVPPQGACREAARAWPAPPTFWPEPTVSPSHARSVVPAPTCTRQRTRALLCGTGVCRRAVGGVGRGGCPRLAARTQGPFRSLVCVCGTVHFVPLLTDDYGSFPLSGIKCPTPLTVSHGPFLYFFSWRVRIPRYTETQRPVVSGHPRVKPSLRPIL